MGSHYIPVGKLKIDKSILDIACPAAGYDNTPPPPEIYCPVAGYIPDPTIYHEDPVITNAPKPGDGQIRLIVTDSGSRHVQFKCQVSNTGKYVVTVTGADDVVIETQTKNNNSVCQVFVPLLEGYVADGYTYYYIDIAPELEGNDLTLFQATINTTYDSLGGYIIAAFFNTPGMLDLKDAFKNNKRVQSAEFLSDMDDLTTLLAFAQGASEFKKLVLPESLPEITVMTNMLNASGIIDLTFPKNLPKITYMGAMLHSVPLKSFVFPENLPLLQELTNCFQNSEIQNISFAGDELPEVTTILNFANGASKLKTITYPEMPLLTTIENANYNCDNIEYITYQGGSPLITTIKNTASNCPKLKKIVFPEVIENISSIANIQNVVDNCDNLEEIVMPKTLLAPNYTSTTQYFFNKFQGCYKLEKISTIENATYGNLYGRMDAGFLTSLKRFDQPNLIFYPNTNVIFTPNTGMFGKLEYFEIDWGQFQKGLLNFERQNMPISEVRRILSKFDFPVDDSLSEFKLKDNPDWSAIQGYWNPSTVLNSGRTMRFTIANWDARIKVGSSLFISLGNGRNSQMIIRTNDFFTLHDGVSSIVNFFAIAPFNGTRCIIRDSKWESFGLFTKKIYYVVNSDEDSGLDFQLSETLGGQPVQFSFTQNEFDVDTLEGRVTAFFDCYVSNINFTGTYYEVDMTFPIVTSAGQRTGTFIDPDYFDFWEFYIKGFKPAVF